MLFYVDNLVLLPDSSYMEYLQPSHKNTAAVKNGLF